MILTPQIWPIPIAARPDLELALGKPLPEDSRLVLFKAIHNGRTFFCAQVGGDMGDPDEGELLLSEYGAIEMSDGEVMDRVSLTPHGQAAAMAVLEWAMSEDSKHEAVFVQLVAGPTPIIEKIRHALDKSPHNAILLFVGDFAEELDGAIIKLLQQSLEEGEI